MAKKMLIDATHAEETRVVVADGTKVDEFDFEALNRRQLAGNIYLAKVTRVEPSLQAAFVDYGGNRHGFLAFSEIHPDYYQIPKEDRDALLAEEMAQAAADDEDEVEPEPKPKRRSRGRGRRKKAPAPEVTEAAETTAEATEVSGDDAAPVEANDEAATASDGETPPEMQEEPPVEAAEATSDTVDEVSEPQGADAPEATDAPDSSDAEDETPKPDSIAESTGLEDETVSQDPEEPVATEEPVEISGMDVIDVDEADDGPDLVETTSEEDSASTDTEEEQDLTVETVADADDQEEIRPPRRPKVRRYKIQEVVKVRQIMLVQVVKEERGNKGAALTTYLSLAGRYCVLMPNTARGGGISRKITNVSDRKKLKEIATEIDVPKGAGLIIRTAGAKRTKTEIKRDYEYLQRQWEQIRDLTLKSVAPAPIYEEGDLIRRSIRDLYSREIDEVLVEGETGYRQAKDFMKMIMPSHAKNVKQYTDRTPLFARYQVENYLSGMFNPTVQLKSGGYIVIGVTEALVAIDVNSGRATKEGSIEDTAVKTNLEAAEEVARQLRLRDLAGLIVIDFIDMDERKNNVAVENRMKDALKADRARIQVGRISGFGLMEMSRQRLRPGMLEATTQPCPHCHGTGLIRSDDNTALQILRALEEEGMRRRTKEVLLKVPVATSNFLINNKREHLAQIEARFDMAVRIEADLHMIPPQYELEKFKTATRIVPKPESAIVSLESSYVEESDEAEVIEAEAVEATPETEEEKPKKRRRRRSRRRGKGGDKAAQEGTQETEQGEAKSEAEASESPVEAADAAPVENAPSEPVAPVVEPEVPAAQEEVAAPETSEPEAPAKPKRKARVRAKAPAPVAEEAPAEESGAPSEDVSAETVEAQPVADAAPEEDTSEQETKPKRRGWWRRG